MSPYILLTGIHNIMRWLVLLSAVWALVNAYSGLFGKRTWQSSDRQAGLVFNIMFGLQFILGLILYGVSPISRSIMSDPSRMSDSYTRFFGVEHTATMIIAFIIAQIAYSRSKRLSSNKAKFRWAAIGYTIAVLLVLAAIPWNFIDTPWKRPLWPSYLFG